jgi:hypothetical protein
MFARHDRTHTGGDHQKGASDVHGCVIEHRPCPRCDNRRTARFGTTSFCFNCRSRVSDDIDLITAEDMSYEFTSEELLRLVMYRDAIRAGLYTDQL